MNSSDQEKTPWSPLNQRTSIKKRKLIKCPECNGRGWGWTTVIFGENYENIPEGCGNCWGTGKIELLEVDTSP